MQLPTDSEILNFCKQQIADAVEWKVHGNWKNRDFEYLSEQIFKKTKTSLSVSTLKRIWKNEEKRNPHISTLNALAQFLDFEDWNTYKTDILKNYNGKNLSKKKLRLNKKVIVSIVALFIITLTTAYWLKNTEGSQLPTSKIPLEEIEDGDVHFTTKKSITSGLPNSVVFNYDIKHIEFDSAFIQQNWDKRKRKEIAREDNYHTSIYYYPGFYTARLVLNNTIVKKHPLFIKTKGWMGIYVKEFKQEVPLYFKNINLYKNTGLHVSINDIKKNNIENDNDFYVGMLNYQDFGEINGDSLTFETVIKNNIENGGLTCQYAIAGLKTERGNLYTCFCDTGCISNAFLRFGDVYIDGKKNDLSSLGTNLSNWRKITYKIRNKAVQILIDESEVYQLSFHKDVGKVIGIYYYFYGFGAVKMVKLYDKNNHIAFSEDFILSGQSSL